MANPPARLKFGASQRVKNGRDFENAKLRGERTTCGCLILNWIRQPGQTMTRLGVITPRNVGPAVVRNRARRLLRESFRRHQHELDDSLDLILVARRSIEMKSFKDVESDFLTATRKAKLLQPAAK